MTCRLYHPHQINKDILVTVARIWNWYNKKYQNNVNESVLSIKQLREQKRRKEEEEEISRIIAKIQGEHISSLPESQQIKNQIHTQIKQEHVPWVP